MIKSIVKDMMFLGQKSKPVTREDLPIAKDLQDTLAAHREDCVGMAANMIGYHKNMIIVSLGMMDLVMETCKRTILISDGRITADDDTVVILNHKELLEENGLELPLLLQGRLRSKEGMTNEDTVH